ncbi:LVIVD repeat-containing protein [Flaviaesturariibacter aridisoli]|uniref:LVIVD repeat-containing protein n=1 Tax=Flaviaesturariibacter aridisoli TaxID=2545761 RepID=A0A4V2WMJ7_9BACT|nr:hypothetical protein [Flaviaesturariibacter aridisoli]TCZ70142.1 hypothetical protein E0486_11325 [Flaviaesturariibacter aridisoli]
MKRLLLALLLPALLLGSCARQAGDCRTVQKIRTPYYKPRSEVRSAMHSGPARNIDQPGKLYIYGSYVFLSDVNTGIHIIDNSNPAVPVQKAFLTVAGNNDIAVQGHYLYADSWSDLVVFDLSDLNQIVAVTFLPGVFPNIGSPWNSQLNALDTSMLIAGYHVRDTVVACSSGWGMGGGPMLANASGGSASGVAGSMARFALTAGHLYTVNGNDLRAFSLANPADPQSPPPQLLNANAETVYPFGNSLFIGTTTGMHIYDISNPAHPSYLSRFDHARLCDPVITDGTDAYVTLRSGGFCLGSQNELNVLRVTDLRNPVPLRTYPLANPHGLAKDGNRLFVCDGDAGLKVYDAQNPSNLQLLETVPVKGTYDVIAQNGLLLLVAADGLYQYRYERYGAWQPLTALSRIQVY